MCSETLTTGCTEARTPNTPDPYRYSGSRTVNPGAGVITLAAKKWVIIDWLENLEITWISIMRCMHSRITWLDQK